MNLSQREKIYIAAAAAAVSLFLILQFVIFPLQDKQGRLAAMIDDKKKTLFQMQALKTKYEAARKQADLSRASLANRPRGFTLFSFLDALAGQAGVKGHIAYMKPTVSRQGNEQFKTSTVEMKLQSVNLKQIIDFLYLVETSKNEVYVRRMSLSRRTEKESLLDMVLQVETYILSGSV